MRQQKWEFSRVLF